MPHSSKQELIRRQILTILNLKGPATYNQLLEAINLHFYDEGIDIHAETKDVSNALNHLQNQSRVAYSLQGSIWALCGEDAPPEPPPPTPEPPKAAPAAAESVSDNGKEPARSFNSPENEGDYSGRAEDEDMLPTPEPGEHSRKRRHWAELKSTGPWRRVTPALPWQLEDPVTVSFHVDLKLTPADVALLGSKRLGEVIEAIATVLEVASFVEEERDNL